MFLVADLTFVDRLSEAAGSHFFLATENPPLITPPLPILHKHQSYMKPNSCRVLCATANTCWRKFYFIFSENTFCVQKGKLNFEGLFNAATQDGDLPKNNGRVYFLLRNFMPIGFHVSIDI